MASFTDLIPQFNPYIQQLPVEAMVTVGMEKQKRYDEGVQKIQSQINEIAGLDIYKDQDRVYLQSKLNELGNNLKVVAAGDFSNFQLVNSVSGMTSQISKDPIVRNAVMSTAKLRKEMGAMEEYRKSGKSDKNNEEYFMSKVVKPYLESGLKDDNGNLISFNGSFSPYTDITGLINDGIKNAGLDTSVIQQMYRTDNQGRLVFNEKGEPIPARTMTEVEESTNTKQVKAIVENVLRRGDVQNQLNIDGWANTRNIAPQTIINNYREQYGKKIAEIDDDLLKVNTLLTGKMGASEKASLEEQLNDLKNSKQRYKDQYMSLGALAQADPDAFKQSYYKTNYENNLLEQFTKHEKKVKNLKSPLTEQLNWEADYAFKERKEAFDQRIAVRKQNLDERKAQLEEFKFEAEYEYDQTTRSWKKKPDPNKPSDGSQLRLTADVPGEENRTAVQRQEAQVRAIEQKNAQTGMELMYNYLYKLNDGRDSDGRPLTRANVIKTVEKFARDNSETTDQFLTRWILDLDNEAKVNGIQLSRSDREAIGNFKTNHYNYTTLLAIGKIADDEAMKATGVDLKEYTKTLNPLNVKLKDGRSVTISKEDILDYMLLIKNDDKGAEDRITAKYGSLKNFPLNTYKSGRLSDDEFEERTRLQRMSGMFTIYTKDWSKFKDASKIKNDILANVINTDEVFSFGEEDKKEMDAAKSRAFTFISGASSLSGLNYDKASALAAVNDANSKISFKAAAPFEEGGQWKGTMMIGTDKGEIIEVDVPVQKDFEQIAGAKFNPYKLNPLRARATASKFGSTNLGTFTTNPRAWESAAIGSENFVSMKSSEKYTPLGADLNVMPNGGYTVTVYFKDKITGKVLEPIEFERIYTSEEQAQADLALLNESMVDKELK
jgi:hypothetical protein